MQRVGGRSGKGLNDASVARGGVLWDTAPFTSKITKEWFKFQNSFLHVISNLLLLTDVFELCPKSLLVMLSYPSATPGALKVKTTAIRLWIEDIVIVLQENKVAAGAFIFGVLWYLISSCLAHFQNLLITLYQ